jgi:hypothetical protein
MQILECSALSKRHKDKRERRLPFFIHKKPIAEHAGKFKMMTVNER